MTDPEPVRPSRRWLPAVAISAIVFVSLALVPIVGGLFSVIPAIEGRVTDAVTGEAIGGVQIAVHFGRSGATEFHAMTLTDRSGLFRLRRFVKWRGLLSMGEYWVTANHIPARPDATATTSPETQVLYNPLSNRRGDPVNLTSYFPVMVRFGDRFTCRYLWRATCVDQTSSADSLSIRLIPVFDDPKACETIADGATRERCRQLNTYRAAFLHVDTYDDAQRARRLCTEVGDDRISQSCRQQLAGSALYPDGFDRLPPRPSAEPRLNDLFPGRIADLVRDGEECDRQGYWQGHLLCRADYINNLRGTVVSVTFEEWSDRIDPPADTLDKFEIRPLYTDNLRATISRESRAEGTIRMYRGPENIAADWVSGNRYVRLFFHERTQLQETLIGHYLSRFPSTLQ